MLPRTVFASSLGLLQLAFQTKHAVPDGEAYFYSDDAFPVTNPYLDTVSVQEKVESKKTQFRQFNDYSHFLQASYDQLFKANCQKFSTYVAEEKLMMSNAYTIVKRLSSRNSSLSNNYESDKNKKEDEIGQDDRKEDDLLEEDTKVKSTPEKRDQIIFDSSNSCEKGVNDSDNSCGKESNVKNRFPNLPSATNSSNTAQPVNYRYGDGVLADIDELIVELRNYPIQETNFLSTDHVDIFIELFRIMGNPIHSFCQVNSTMSSTFVMQDEPNFDELANHCMPFDDTTRFCFLPLCRHQHWTLLVLDRVFWAITHYDPLVQHNKSITPEVRFGQEVFQRIFNISCRPEFTPVTLPDSWVQRDNFNCGVYISQYMERIAKQGQDWLNETHKLDITTERRRIQNIFEDIVRTKSYPLQWVTVADDSNKAQVEHSFKRKFPEADLSDDSQDCTVTNVTSAPKKRGRPAKKKGSRPVSQATKTRLKRITSQLYNQNVKTVSKAQPDSFDLADIDSNSINMASLSVADVPLQVPLRQKRKQPTRGSVPTPSPVIRKRPTLHSGANSTHDDIFIFEDDDESTASRAKSTPILSVPQKIPTLQTGSNNSDFCDTVFNNSDLSSQSGTDEEDGDELLKDPNDGMLLDLDVALQRTQISEEFEPDDIPDDDHEPMYVELDGNYDFNDLSSNPFDIGTAFSEDAIIEPHPTYRNDSEMVGFLTAMAYFAVKEGGRWRSIAILDSSVCGRQTLAAPIRNYIRGYYEHPDLILHPAFARGRTGTDVGHWFLLAIDVTEYQMTVYDSMIDPSAKNDKDNVLPDSRYLEYANTVCDHLIKGKYIVRRPNYIRHRPHSYNKQVDGANCGVHVARIAEEIAFKGITRELYPFDIKKELERMLQTCREIHFHEGLPKTWPDTCQAVAFPLMEEDVRAIKRLPKPIALQTVPKKNQNPKPTTPKDEQPSPSTVPSISLPRRSTRSSTKKHTQRTDNVIFDRKQLRSIKKKPKKNVALGRISANFIPERISFGKMDKRCRFCNGYLFREETCNRCCGFGTIPVLPFKPYPQPMERVLKDPEFIENFRAFNTMMSFVTVTCQLQRQMDIFVVSGEFKYQIGDILPQGDALPRFEQNYCFDPDEAVNNRNNDAARFGLDPLKYADKELLSILETVVRKYHPLASKYKSAVEEYRDQLKKAEKDGIELPRAYLIWEARDPTDGTHAGQYSKPTVQNTVFKVWYSDGSQIPEKCMMISMDRSNGFRRQIPFYSAHIDPASYPLMFIHGELGWQPGMRKCDPANHPNTKRTLIQKGRPAATKNLPKLDPSKRRISVKSSPSYHLKKRHVQQVVPCYTTRSLLAAATVSQHNNESPTTDVLPMTQPSAIKDTPSKNQSTPENSDSLATATVSQYNNKSTTTNVPPMTQPSTVKDKPSKNRSTPANSDEDVDSDADDGPHHNPHVSMRGFHVSRLYDRNDHEHRKFHPITGARKLTHVYIIDTFLKAERQKLDKLEAVQRDLELRTDRYKPLREHLDRLIANDPVLKGKKVGRILKLSHEYRSSPADMRRRYHNGVAINARVGKGKSDLFITFTGNPMWPEIQDNLRTHYDPPECWTDRPDLVNRVFILYAKAFLRDIIVHGVLGKVIAYNYSVEHQKRGMPHIHLLVILHKKWRKLLQTAKGINDLLCAELPPFPDEDGTVRTSRLRYYRKLVESKYMHHPSKCAQFCGMNKRDPSICNKRYPKPFSEVTVPNATGYAQLRRPDNGRFVPTKFKGKPFELTNRYVVPHNRYLALKYDCHINVEDVRNVRSIKYIYKYNFKGHDRGFVKAVQALGKGADPNVVDYNEIELFRSTRVIGAAEADMRLRTGLPVTKCSHVVQVLPVHLPAEHSVIFLDGATPSQLEKLVADDGVSEDSPAVSQLTAFFHSVREESDNNAYKRDPTRACNLRYAQMPEHYIWERKKKEWRRRIVDRKCIGRMDTVYPGSRERYCLRELLHHRKGPRSFEDLRTVNGHVMETFEAAAIALELFVDDRLSVRTMREAIAIATPRKCRLTFALLLVFNRPQDPEKLWSMFKSELISSEPLTATWHERERRALSHIASILYHHGLSMTDLTLPEVTNEEIMEAIANDYIDEEYERDVDGSKAYSQLNPEQRSFVDRVTDAVHDPSKHKLFFLQGSGGTGKTFVYNTLIRRLRHQGKTVLAVASTGVAAILLHGGQTVHSAFKLPIDFDELRSVSAQDKKAVLAARADIIIWDEAPMQHNIVVRTVDDMLRDWMGKRFTPFGGKVVVMGGDFKQILPVVPGGTVHDAYAASLLCCPVFTENFAVFTLTSNIRAKKDPAYAAWIQSVGLGEDRVFDGRPGKENNLVIRFPTYIVEKSKQKVMDFVYPRAIFEPSMSIEEYQKNVEKAAIVAPTNSLVDLYNSLIVALLPKKSKCYKASNWPYKTENSEEDTLRSVMDTEIMEVFEKPGFALQNLILKERSVVMLTRNLCIRNGLCNGTRMIVLTMLDNILHCRLITGSHAGSVVAIPMVEHVHDDAKDDAFPPFIRLQFPVRPAFAISINKSQGQTLNRVGIMLDSQCFAHGQLYVALSRAGSSENVKVYLPSCDFIRDGATATGLGRNIVHRQVIQAVEHNMKQLFKDIM